MGSPRLARVLVVACVGASLLGLPGVRAHGSVVTHRQAEDERALAREVGQLVVLRFAGTSAPEYVRDALRDGRAAGAILFRDNLIGPAQAKAVVTRLRRAQPRPLICVDQEGGTVRIVSWVGPGRSAREQSAAGSERSDAVAAARALRAIGINVVLAPVADVPSVPRAALAPRAFSSDFAAAAESVRESVRGWRLGGVAPTVKHFPGLGAATVNTDDGSVTISRSAARLRRQDLAPFRSAIAAGVPLVMVGHAKYPVLDRRHIASQSKAVVDGMLRGELGFRGVVITDSTEAAAVLRWRLQRRPQCATCVRASTSFSPPAEARTSRCSEGSWPKRVAIRLSARAYESPRLACSRYGARSAESPAQAGSAQAVSWGHPGPPPAFSVTSKSSRVGHGPCQDSKRLRRLRLRFRVPIRGEVDLENTLLTWLPIIFFGVVICLLLWTIRFMPRAKPAPVIKGSQVEVSWGDVAGLDGAKEELKEVVDFLRDRNRFERLGARVPRGILLHGPPGTGKTLLAKAVASASGANFYSQSASSFVEMFAGLGAARIRKLFEEARKNAPAIVFIDELDAVGTARVRAAPSIGSTTRL